MSDLTIEERHPELFQPQVTIDRRKCHRIVPMKVLNLGISRTGTLSMQKALTILGLPCNHFLDLLTQPTDCDIWTRAIHAKYHGIGKPFALADWDQLLGHLSAVSDMPSYLFAQDLLAAYPESKVVLVERDIDDWYRSFCVSFVDAGLPDWGHYFGYLDPAWTGRLRWFAELCAKVYYRAESQAQLKANAKQIYREHYAFIRSITPKERLLEYELGSGWGPLCEFLELPVPERPFPFLNEREFMAEKSKLIILKTLRKLGRRMLVFGVPLLVAGAAWYYAKSR